MNIRWCHVQKSQGERFVISDDGLWWTQNVIKASTWKMMMHGK
jgi:hypothetical protein